MTVTELVRNAVRRCGYDIVRFKPRFDHPLDLLGLLIRDELSRDPDFVFVQAGANDGRRADPLRRSVLRYNLRGLLIEPLPDMFARLQETYAGQPGLVFENCAIAEHDGQQSMYRVRLDAPVPAYMHGAASFSRQHLSQMAGIIPDIEKYIERVTVPARPLASLILQHGLTKVSLLVVDTEGYDAKVVEAALAAGLRPASIMYEHRWLSHTAQLACTQLLKQCEYRFLEMGMDTYAVRDISTE